MTERIDIAKAREMLEGTTKGEFYHDGFSEVWSREYDEPVARCERPEDAAFIANAHNTYAALLDELEVARAEIERLQKRIVFWNQTAEQAVHRINEMEGEE
jgi:hypothetical protein